MLNNPPWNFHTFDKIISAFGYIFSDISIVRDVTGKTIKVPIEFASKEKWDIRTKEDPNAGNEVTQRHVEIVLPRMGYELTGFHYDSKRKLSSVNYRVNPITAAPGSSITTALKQLNPVPMIFTFTLYLQTRSLSDGWAIMSQFIPFFQPDFVVTIMDIPEMNLPKDITFTLLDSSSSDSYMGNFIDKRTLEWQFNFEARGHLYQPIKEKKIITHAEIGLANSETITSTISPDTANIDEPFEIDVTITDN